MFVFNAFQTMLVANLIADFPSCTNVLNFYDFLDVILRPPYEGPITWPQDAEAEPGARKHLRWGRKRPL